MTYSKQGYAASVKYKAEKIKRVPLDVQTAFYDEIKAAADRAGESVNGYIKEAIRQRMERDGLPAADPVHAVQAEPHPEGDIGASHPAGQLNLPNFQKKKALACNGAVAEERRYKKKGSLKNSAK